MLIGSYLPATRPPVLAEAGGGKSPCSSSMLSSICTSKLFLFLPLEGSSSSSLLCPGLIMTFLCYLYVQRGTSNDLLSVKSPKKWCNKTEMHVQKFPKKRPMFLERP